MTTNLPISTPASTAQFRLTGTSHVFEFLTRSGHYHFGEFGVPRRKHDRIHTPELLEALDRLALRDVDGLNSGDPVLDVGCGNGGTTRLLARRGHSSVGIDPALGSIQYARSIAAQTRSSASFVHMDLESLARRQDCSARFGSAVVIEVSQHFASLREMFRLCRGLLKPHGVILMRDIFTVHHIDRHRVPYHAQADFIELANAAGLEFVRAQDLTNAVEPTVDAYRHLLEQERHRLYESFGANEPNIGKDIFAIDANLRMLGRAFDNGDIRYLSAVIRCRR